MSKRRSSFVVSQHGSASDFSSKEGNHSRNPLCPHGRSARRMLSFPLGWWDGMDSGLYGVWTHDLCDTGAVYSWLVSSVVPTELTSQLGASYRRVFFFSGLIFTTPQVVFITAKIAFIFASLSAVYLYDFHIFIVNLISLIRKNCA